MGDMTAPENFILNRLQSVGHREVVLFPNLRALPPELIHSASFEEASQASCGWDGRRRGTSELVMIRYTVRGSGRFRYDGREVAVEAGQTMLVHLSSEHRHWIEDGSEWEFLSVTLGGQNAVRALREVIARMGPVVTFDAKSGTLTQLAETCALVLEEQIDTPYRASELARNLITALRAETLDKLDVPEQATRAKPDFVSDVETFCRSNLSRPIGVADMAKVARMSRYHFTRKFERARGISPGRFLASLRLDEATRLLSHGGHSVKEVAVQCGFRDASYFCKVFRRNFGVSPGALQLASTSSHFSGATT
jgi:AraC-like DNA-binding protein